MESSSEPSCLSSASFEEENDVSPPQQVKMAAVIGMVTTFDKATQSWEEYSEMLDFFFEANDITEPERRKAVLLSGIGASTYSLLRNLVSPALPKDKTYNQLTAELRKHFDPKPSEIMRRFKFNS